MQAQRMDRRAFLKGAIAASAVAALPLSVMTGCSSDVEKAQGESNVATGLSEEERAAFTPDPSYSGGKTNFCGQEFSVGTGTNGEVANQALIDQQAEYLPAHLVKITDRIYNSIGNCLAHSTMVIGDTGIIIIDTGECQETAQLDYDLYKTVTDKPVVAVIYTHNHYAGGTTAYIPSGNPDNVPIIAHSNLMNALLSPFTETATSYVDRAHMMLGDYLPIEGEDGRTTCGVGPFYNNPYITSYTPGFIKPNTWIDANEKEVVKTIDGLTFHFYPTVSDSPDNINIYIEEENTIVTNQAWGVMYNMYTLRGERYRDPVAMIAALDVLRGLHADNMVTVAGLPLIGKKAVEEGMTLHRDAMQYVYDQTIRYMNKGYTPDQIVAAVKIPEFMANGAITQPVYGEFEHYVRGVFSGLIGWFSGDALDLHPVSRACQSAYVVKVAGGADRVVDDAQTALEDNQYAWAATLATYVIDTDADNDRAKQIKAQAFRKMGHVSGASNTRHWYHSAAAELEGKLDKSLAPAVITKDKLMAAPRKLVLDMLRVSIDPEKAEGMNESLVVTYIDEDVSVSMTVRNCIGEVVEGAVEKPSVELRIPYVTMLDIVTGEREFDEVVSSGDAQLVGDASKLEAIMGVCEMQL